MGNGVSYPSTSFLLRTEVKTIPGQQVYNSYGQLSFQQKLLSFGWIDRAQSQDAFCLTVLNLPSYGGSSAINCDTTTPPRPKQIEIKTAMSLDGMTRVGITGESPIAGPASKLAEKGANIAVRAYMDHMQCGKGDAISWLQAALADRVGDLLKGKYESELEIGSPAATRLARVVEESDALFIRRVEVESALRLLDIVAKLKP
jgi:hypothetical protein